MFSATVKGIKQVLRENERAKKATNKAFITSVKVEGFRLMKIFKKEIRAGSPGGRRFSPISMINRKIKRSSKVLNRLALGVRYQVDKKPFAFRFGWVGSKVSKSWKRLAEKHQMGFETEVTEKMRSRFRRWGAGMTKRSKYRPYFFIKKSTSKFKTPARPMRDPFWEAHEKEVFPNVRRNFRRKMAGERI